METPIYLITSDTDVTLPKPLEESFIAFISASGMPFAPEVKVDGERSHIHFLFLNKDLKPLVEEFMAKFEPDGYYTYEVAVPNDRVKHAERIHLKAAGSSLSVSKDRIGPVSALSRHLQVLVLMNSRRGLSLSAESVDIIV